MATTANGRPSHLLHDRVQAITHFTMSQVLVFLASMRVACSCRGSPLCASPIALDASFASAILNVSLVSKLSRGRSSGFASAKCPRRWTSEHHRRGPSQVSDHRWGRPPKIPIPQLAAALIQRWLSSHSLMCYPKSHWPGVFVAYLNCVRCWGP